MTEMRIVGLTVMPRAGQVLHDAEIAFSSVSGRITHVGSVRVPLFPDDIYGAGRLVSELTGR